MLTSRDVLFHALSTLSGQRSSRTAILVKSFFWTRAPSGESHSSHVTDQRVDTAWSSINNIAQIILANFLCCDECITTQSIADL